MKKDNRFSKQKIILYCFGLLVVAWFALLIAPSLKDGLGGVINNFTKIMESPFHIEWCENSLRTVLLLILIYGVGIGVYLSNDRNYRKREEHGSAKWGNPESVNRKYAEKDPLQNIILTKHVKIGLDGRKHRRNLNVLVCGGSGAGKTRFYAKPNILNANCSLVILDPNGYNLGG